LEAEQKTASEVFISYRIPVVHLLGFLNCFSDLRCVTRARRQLGCDDYQNGQETHIRTANSLQNARSVVPAGCVTKGPKLKAFILQVVTLCCHL
jgi:hypothetical protein